jgi:DNA-binding CsgD family transcriptional regulator
MIDDRIGSPDYRLTPQETRVLTLLLRGHHKKTAADAMGVSINTVSFHLKNAYCKLGVHSKTEAVVKGLLEGILVLDQAASEHSTAA